MQKHLLLSEPNMLLKSIVSCLEQLTSEAHSQEHPITVFNLKNTPTLSLSDYIARFFKFMGCSPSAFIYALALIDVAQQNNPTFTINRNNIYRLFLTAVVVAAKYLDDFFYKNSFYASVGGISVAILNQLEWEFLKLINFNSHVHSSTFQIYLSKLEEFTEIHHCNLQQKTFLKSINEMLPEKSTHHHPHKNFIQLNRNVMIPNENRKDDTQGSQEE